MNEVLIYALMKGNGSTLRCPPPTMEFMQTVLPLLRRGGGEVPKAPRATFSVEITTSGIDVVVNHGRWRLAICAAYRRCAEDSQLAWELIAEAGDLPADSPYLQMPEEPVWAAVAVAPYALALAGGDVREVSDFLCELMPALVTFLCAWDWQPAANGAARLKNRGGRTRREPSPASA